MAAVLPDLAAAFGAGLLGSLHCIGMCGPLALVGCRAGLARQNAVAPLLFVTGKLGSYALLGLIAGLAGALLAAQGSFGRAAAWVAIGGGLLMLVILGLGRLKIAGRTSGLSIALAKLSWKLGRKAPLLLGVAAALLPCGLLYAMVARSAAAGEPVMGMALMAAFGVGTSPALLGIGTLLRSLPQRWSRWGSVAGEVVLALTAGVLIWRGFIGLAAAATGQACCH